MSWWDTSNITSFASQALKNAQKTIDKALDISEDETAKGQASAKSAISKHKKKEKAAAGGGGEFWNSWLGAGQESQDAAIAPEGEKEEKKKKPSQSTSPSSWSFGWGGQSDEIQTEEETPSSWSTFDLSKYSSSGVKTKGQGITDKVESKPREATPKTKKEETTETNTLTQEEKAAGPLQLGQKRSSRSPRSSSSDVAKVSETTIPSVSESKEVESDDVQVKDSVPAQLSGASAEVSGEAEKVTTENPDDSKAEEVQSSDGLDNRTVSELDSVVPVSFDDASDKIVSDNSNESGSQLVTETSVSEEVLSGKEIDVSQGHQSEDMLGSEKTPDSEVTPSNESTENDSIEQQADTDSPDVLPADSSPDKSDTKSDSVASSFDTGTLLTSCDSELDVSQRVTLDIPNSDFKEQSQVGPSTPLSSEASIITLSSPGQDDLDYQCSPPQTVSTTSEYINISTTQLQTSEDNVYIPHSTSTPSVESVESEQADASVLEQEFLDREQADLGQSSGNDSSDASKLDSSMDTCTSGDTVVDPNQGVAKHDGGHGSDNEHDIEKSDESFPATSPNTSFVKNMLEDAMEDVAKPEDSGSDNHSGGDKSESSKVESEIDKSISGHESSDDIETTTSSDIEIISTPTPNGDRSERPFDLSPLRIALQKTVRRDRETHSHRRSDSQSSGSTYSKAGESDQMSPGRDSLERQELESGDEELRPPDLSAVTEEDMDNPYHPQKLLQGANTPQQHGEVIKKLASQAEVLQHRENKVVQLSKENNDLLETNSILRNQLQQLEELRESEMMDVNTLTEEFTKRLSEAEKKLQNSIKEKETIKRQLQTAQDELRKSASDISQESLLAEKDEQITELMQEGEKLSKQVLQSNNIIKKLRAKEKENESLLASQKKKLEEQKTELEHLRKVCEAKDDLEKKQTEAIHQLNGAVQKQEKDILKYKSDHDESEEKLRSLQVALDNAYKEIADLHKMNAAQGSKAQEAALSAEVAVREQLKMEMEQEGLRYKKEREALIMQIEDLRLSMARMEKDHNRREDMLRQEISDLQMQLQEDETRNQELTHSVSSATRPLLRQIENLQSNYSAQSASWEKVEKNLTERLAEAQSQLAIAIEKERTASEKLMDQNVRVTTLESQTARLRQEKSQLLAQAEMDKAKVELLEEAKLNEMAQIDVIKNKFTKEISELKKDKVFLETQVEMETSKLETEKKKVVMLEEQIKLLERERPRSRGTPSPVSVSRQESYSSFQAHPEFLPVLPQEDLLERTLMLASPNGSKMNLYESLRQSGAATLLENLQSQLKQREGEIMQLQSEISSLERTRESMAKELVNLTNKNEILEEQALELPLLQEKYKDLDGRYNALLQMYGEKVEQAEELKLDLQDVKDMYKAQIDELLAK